MRMGGGPLSIVRTCTAGGVRAQQGYFSPGIFRADVPGKRAAAEVKRVLRIARAGVVGGGVQRIEAEKLRLDLGSVRDRKTDLVEDPAHFLAHQRERVVGAGAGIRRRQGRVHRGAELGGQLRLVDAPQRGVEAAPASCALASLSSRPNAGRSSFGTDPICFTSAVSSPWGPT